MSLKSPSIQLPKTQSLAVFVTLPSLSSLISPDSASNSSVGFPPIISSSQGPAGCPLIQLDSDTVYLEIESEHTG